MVVLLAMLIGAELVLVPAAEMDLIMKVMKSHRPTWVPGVPTLYEKIINGSNFLETGLPESFHVLVKELKGLCLDIELLEE